MPEHQQVLADSGHPDLATDARWDPPPPHEFTNPMLPTAVRVYEVGHLDDLQGESATVPTEVKAEFCRRLVVAGVRSLEVTSSFPRNGSHNSTR
ncbi:MULTISPECIES: hypothetical protein [Rhodococcus]|uniref:hypothetical protein n=1 Tax=Rhodococcus globerulus TaxID=33008 RepID=UPI001FD1EB74|nr:hypothetical protein [Rhodococcus globerulus]